MKYSLDELKKKSTMSTPRNGEQNTSLASLRQDLGLKKTTNQGGTLTSRINSLAVKNIDNAALERRNNAIELIFILDKSGSCKEVKGATIKGVNDLIEAEKKTGSIVKVTIILFDDEYEVICKGVDINLVPKLSYEAIGGTSLYDTLYTQLSSLKHEQAIKGEIKPEKTLVAIMTDGLDEHSEFYNVNDARNMIQSCIQIGWQIIFLGANIDAKKEAIALGLDPEYAEQYIADNTGVLINFQSVRKALSELRTYGKINPDWSNNIKQYNSGVARLQTSDSKIKQLRLNGGYKHE